MRFAALIEQPSSEAALIVSIADNPWQSTIDPMHIAYGIVDGGRLRAPVVVVIEHSYAPL